VRATAPPGQLLQTQHESSSPSSPNWKDRISDRMEQDKPA
jgi:hypothetical protein